MNIYNGDVMNHIIKKGYTNQRIIAEETGHSLGKVNSSIKNLIKEGYLDKEFGLTEKFYKEIKARKPQNAIILAAGFGMRMVPINNEIPKGLLEVRGDILIERLIEQLQEVGIFKIDIVVGFLKEKFEYLIDKYGVNLVYNPEYASKNNLHSLQLVAKKISNTYILPSDIWSKENPFSNEELYSWYSIMSMDDNESTVKINRQLELNSVPESKAGNAMIGISYILSKDAKLLRANIEELSKDRLYDNTFWEEALFKGKEKINIYGRIFNPKEVVEINTYEQLREIDDSSKNLNTDIINLIARELNVVNKNIQDITVLKKGMTNRSFLFRIGDKKYIMRIPGEGTSQLIDREQEYKVYHLINKLSISDNVIYISPKSGYKITEFIEGSRVCDPFNINDVKSCMKKLRDFHNMKLQVDHTFDVFEKIEFYERLWKSKPSIFKDYSTTKKNIFKLKEVIKNLPKEWVLTHIDAVPDNFLFTDDGIRIIDWEYAAMQDPHLDIAMFAIYSMYDREQVEALIDSYFTEGCSEDIRIKIYCYIAACGLLWSNWCEYKRLLGVEFGEYSLRQYRFAKEYYLIVMKEYGR